MGRKTLKHCTVSLCLAVWHLNLVLLVLVVKLVELDSDDLVTWSTLVGGVFKLQGTLLTCNGFVFFLASLICTLEYFVPLAFHTRGVRITAQLLPETTWLSWFHVANAMDSVNVNNIGLYVTVDLSHLSTNPFCRFPDIVGLTCASLWQSNRSRGYGGNR